MLIGEGSGICFMFARTSGNTCRGGVYDKSESCCDYSVCTYIAYMLSLLSSEHSSQPQVR
jgi:hypothetical protein